MQIKLIIGLGNEAKEFRRTYHNCGFIFVDFLRAFAPFEEYISILPVVKTTGFMNQTGEVVRGYLREYRSEPSKTLIVHDDSDLELGRYKFSFDRGSSGHKGVEDIFDTTRATDFWRLRIGIRKANNTLPALDFVLDKILETEFEILNAVFLKSATELLKSLKLSSSSN